MLDLQHMANALGGHIINGAVRCPGPGHSKFDDSLVVTPSDNRDGFVVYSHAGDDFIECKDHVREKLGLASFRGIAKDIDPVERARRELALKTLNENVERKASEKRKSAKAIWDAAKPFKGSLAERYLTGRMAGLQLPEAIYDGGSLRFVGINGLPSHFRKAGEGAAGAMVALMTDAITIEPTGIHLTFVTSDGSNLRVARGDKLSSVRRMWGNQGVVRLWHDAEVERRLNIGEGIESCIAGHILRGGPVWSGIDAGGVASLPPLVGIEYLRIFTDNDKSETGTRAAEAARSAWEGAGRFVAVEMPPRTGDDFNDFLRSLAAESEAA